MTKILREIARPRLWFVTVIVSCLVVVASYAFNSDVSSVIVTGSAMSPYEIEAHRQRMDTALLMLLTSGIGLVIATSGLIFTLILAWRQRQEATEYDQDS